MFRWLRLMAGDRSSLDSEETLKAILKAGVTCIVPGQQRSACHSQETTLDFNGF
jgi:hypothetical protein